MLSFVSTVMISTISALSEGMSNDLDVVMFCMFSQDAIRNAKDKYEYNEEEKKLYEAFGFKEEPLAAYITGKKRLLALSRKR